MSNEDINLWLLFLIIFGSISHQRKFIFWEFFSALRIFHIKKNLYDFMSICVHLKKCPRGRFYYLITMWVKKTEIKHRKRFAFYAKSGAYSPFTESAKLIGRHRGEKVNKFLYTFSIKRMKTKKNVLWGKWARAKMKRN